MNALNISQRGRSKLHNISSKIAKLKPLNTAYTCKMRRSKFHNTVIHAKWKVDVPKCSKYHWCPICCEYHATRKVQSRNAMLNQRFNLHKEGWRSTVLKIWQAPCQLCLFTFVCFWLWCFRQLSVFLALQGFSGFLTSWLCWCWPQSHHSHKRSANTNTTYTRTKTT